MAQPVDNYAKAHFTVVDEVQEFYDVVKLWGEMKKMIYQQRKYYILVCSVLIYFI